MCFLGETVLFVGRYDQLEIYEEIDDAGRVRPIKICGLCLAENTKVFGTSTTISELSNANSQVQTLEKDGTVSVRKVLGKYSRKVSDYVRVFVAGEELKSSSDHEFKTEKGWFSAGSLRKGMMLFSMALNSFVPIESVANIHEPLTVEGLALGNVEGYGVGKIGVVVAPSNGWCVEGLERIGHQKFNAWINKYLSSLKFGGKVGDEAAGLIAKELETKLVGRNVLSVEEGTTGRLVVQADRGTQTNRVFSIEPAQNGEFAVVEYKPTYDPTANTTYNAAISKRSYMVPDFKGTQYIDDICQSYIDNFGEIRIKMTYQNPTADYQAALSIIKQKYPNFTWTSGNGFTWHHMDDLFIDANGDAFCTMQLVKTSAHEASGMRHSGAVSQLKAYKTNSKSIDIIDND